MQHEFRPPGCGPSTYALVHFDCSPAEDLGFESRAEWPAEALTEKDSFELAIAEAISDALLAGLYQHSGCTISLAKVGYDAVGSSVIAFTKATQRAMQDFLGREQDWEFVAKSATNG